MTVQLKKGYILPNDLKIRTSFELSSTKGMLIAQKNLDTRKPDADGVLTGCVPGHGGAVYWVKHEDNTVGAYSVQEFSITEPHEWVNE